MEHTAQTMIDARIARLEGRMERAKDELRLDRQRIIELLETCDDYAIASNLPGYARRYEEQHDRYRRNEEELEELRAIKAEFTD